MPLKLEQNLSEPFHFHQIYLSVICRYSHWLLKAIQIWAQWSRIKIVSVKKQLYDSKKIWQRMFTQNYTIRSLSKTWRKQWNAQPSSLKMAPNWGRPVDMLRDRAATQGELDRLEAWADRDLMKFSKDRHKAPYLGREKLLQWHRLGTAWLEGQQIEHESAACPGRGMANSIPDFISRNIASRQRGGIILLY